MVDLKEVSKQELIEELEMREGVSRYDVTKDEIYKIRKSCPCGKNKYTLENYSGPITIITVVD